MPMRQGRPVSIAIRAAATKPCHLRRGSRFIDEDQFGGVEVRLVIEPVAAGTQDITALLLAGMRGMCVASANSWHLANFAISESFV